MNYNRLAMNDTEFQNAAEAELSRLNRAMDPVADIHDVEIVYQAGVLTVEVEEPALSKIIVSPNGPARQIWISAQATSFKLDWSPEREAFVLASTGESLSDLLGRILGEELGGDPIAL